MYRLHYQTRGGFWCVQFASFGGLYWETVLTEEKKPMRFETLAQAQKYASESGISRHYKQQLPYDSPTPRIDHSLNGYQPMSYAESNGQI